MSTETIFFSYSRDDSEFVLNLAKNLRIAGANIWLDQLDIKPGTRWDSSIEKALKSSNTLLVILSKTSVDSTNVLDEVSFALEEKKKVVPVLLEECDIPFRLRRLQYADFIGDHKKGITTLVEALDLDQSVASKLADVTTDISVSQQEVEQGKKIKQELDAKKEKGNVKPIEKVEPVEETKDNYVKAKETQEKDSDKSIVAPVKKPKSKAPIFILIGILAVAAAALYYFKDDIFKNQEQIDWNLANAKDEISEYEKFQKQYATGKYSQHAKDSIDRKNNRKDEKAWLIVIENPTIDNYIDYRDNENLAVQKYKERAQDSINILTTRAEQAASETEKDDLAYQVATDGNSVTSFLGYYTNKDVSGNHKAEALAKIDEIGILGWLYAGTASGDEVTSKRVFEVKWRDGDFKSRGIPKDGDVLKSLKSVYTYKSFSNNSVNNATRNPTTIKSGKEAFVKEAVQVGNAVFVQIRY
jgi:hypothetical protein